MKQKTRDVIEHLVENLHIGSRRVLMQQLHEWHQQKQQDWNQLYSSELPKTKNPSPRVEREGV
ncbi:unnamed protein product, partial [Amoebophrya sp. A25]|eukprot:GSA25T00014981001.1